MRDYFNSCNSWRISLLSSFLSFFFPPSFICQNLSFSAFRDKQSCVAAVQSRVTEFYHRMISVEDKHVLFPFPLLHNTSEGAKCCVRPYSRGRPCGGPAPAVQVDGMVPCAHHSRACIILNPCLHLLQGRLLIRQLKFSYAVSF